MERNENLLNLLIPQKEPQSENHCNRNMNPGLPLAAPHNRSVRHHLASTF